MVAGGAAEAAAAPPPPPIRVRPLPAAGPRLSPPGRPFSFEVPRRFTRSHVARGWVATPAGRRRRWQASVAHRGAVRGRPDAVVVTMTRLRRALGPLPARRVRIELAGAVGRRLHAWNRRVSSPRGLRLAGQPAIRFRVARRTRGGRLVVGDEYFALGRRWILRVSCSWTVHPRATLGACERVKRSLRIG